MMQNSKFHLFSNYLSSFSLEDNILIYCIAEILKKSYKHLISFLPKLFICFQGQDRILLTCHYFFRHPVLGTSNVESILLAHDLMKLGK